MGMGRQTERGDPAARNRSSPSWVRPRNSPIDQSSSPGSSSRWGSMSWGGRAEQNDFVGWDQRASRVGPASLRTQSHHEREGGTAQSLVPPYKLVPPDMRYRARTAETSMGND